MTRQEMINALVEYQLDCILQCEDYQTEEEVLRGIFRRGFEGFETMTDEQLVIECLDAHLIEEDENGYF